MKAVVSGTFPECTSSSDERGTSVVETAIILPLLLTLVFGIIQYGFMIYAKIAVQNAAELAARYCITQTSAPSQAQVLAQARGEMIPPMDPANLSVSTYDTAYATPNGTQAYRVQLQYDLPLLIGFVVPGATGGTYPIVAESVMK